MKVLVAGASVAIGIRLVPQLVDHGHEVTGTCRSPDKTERLHGLGAEPIVLDVLDPDAVRKAAVDAKPEAIVHQATALADLSDFKHFDRSFAQTNRLRTMGTDALLAAAREAGVRRFVAQSYANHRYAREGGPVKTEDDPLDPTPVPAMRETEAAMIYLDRAVTAAGGIALRCGNSTAIPTTGWSRPCAHGSSPSSAMAAGSGRSFTSMTPPPRPCSRSSTTVPASTTSWTTSPPPSTCGCQSSRRWSEPSRLNASPACSPG